MAKSKEVLVDAIVELLKSNPVIQDMCSQFGVNTDELSKMPIEFTDLNVSAKTKNGKVYLNNRLLDDDDFVDDIHYIVHETNHWLQQINGDADKYHKDSDLDYLDLPAEIEAFQNQIKFISDTKGRKEAEDYVDHLLDFHEFDGKRKQDKRKELMEKIDDEE